MRNMANGAATSKVLEYPTLANPKEQPEPLKVSWTKRRLLELGVIGMPDSPTQSPGFYVNFSTVSFLILVLGTIAGLWLFTYNVAHEQGVQKARQEMQVEQLKKEAEDARRKADEALKLQTYNARQTDEKDGHAIKQK